MTPINERGEPDRARPALLHERVQGGSGRSRRVDNFIDQNDRPIGYFERDLRFVGIVGGFVVSVWPNIDLSAGNDGSFNLA
jgi:hypothetical protein